MAQGEQMAGAAGQGGTGAPPGPPGDAPAPPAKKDSLGRKALRGGAWIMAATVLSMALRLGSNLILTRMLAPEAFGLMAMVATTHVAMELLSDIGVRLSVIRSDRGDEPRWLRVAWTVQIVRAAVAAAGIALIGAALWAFGAELAGPETVYADPQLPALIAASAILLFFKGCESINKFLAERHMALGRVSLLELASQVAGVCVTIASASVEPSVWAMIHGMAVTQLFRTVATHAWLPGPRMGVVWDRDIAAELWNFGKWLIGASLLTYVSKNTHRLILAGLMAAGPFGVLSIALIWLEAAWGVLTRLNGGLIVQTLSTVRRTDPERLPFVFRRTQLILDAVCLAACGACVLGADLLITTLYEEPLHDAAQHLKVLGFVLLTMRFQPFNAQMINNGDSRGHMFSMGVEAAVVCIGIPLGYELAGVEGALVALTLAPCAAAPVALMRSGREVGADFRREIAMMILVPVACGLFVAL